MRRREAIFLAEEIYFFLKKSPREKYSINKISKKIKAKYEATIKCLQLLKKLNLIKETKGDRRPIPERFFQFLR